jgi:alpha-D-ribose 1-methylphosphonate 5-phosphate C-P lyase
MALWLGHRRRAGDGRLPDARRYAQGDRPGRRRHHQRGLDPQVLREDGGRGGDRRTEEATIIQTRHRIPETPLTEDQILVYQVPIPEPLRFLEPRETETRKMHALEEYGLMHVKLYEDIARHGEIATAYAYPVKVEDRYVMDPSPIPKFDNPKLESAALQLFGAGGSSGSTPCRPHQGREPRFRGLPVRSLQAPHPCALCGAEETYLDEVITDDEGGRMFVCSDTDFCAQRREDAA